MPADDRLARLFGVDDLALGPRHQLDDEEDRLLAALDATSRGEMSSAERERSHALLDKLNRDHLYPSRLWLVRVVPGFDPAGVLAGLATEFGSRWKRRGDGS